MKNTLEGINSRITEAKERISDLEGRMVEISAMEQDKDKRGNSLVVEWLGCHAFIAEGLVWELRSHMPQGN